MAENLPVLSEHEAPDMNPTKPLEYDATPEEKKALKLVNKLFEKAKKHRKQYDEQWPDYYKYWRGRQWIEQRPNYRHSEVVNFVFQTIQSHVPILADAKQRIEYIAQEPSDIEFAKILDKCVEFDWEDGNWTYKLAEILYDGHVIGTGLGGMHYDSAAKLGMGQIKFESEDPFYSYPDPNATDFNEKMRFHVTAVPTDLEEIKIEYPEKGKFVKADLLDLKNDERVNFDQVRFKSPTDNRVLTDGTSAWDLGFKDQALKITLYYFDPETVEEKVETPVEGVDPFTGMPTQTVEVAYVQKLKYPTGRKICIAGGVVLSDGPMELEEKLVPKAKFTNQIDPRVFWGISEVEQIKGPQNIFNKIYCFTLDVLTLMGNPIWVVDTDSGVDTDNLYNRPGLIIEKTKGTEVRREEGTQLQPYVLNILDRVQGYIDSVAGSNDVTRGVKPEGITAASAISSLQEAAQTRIRQKSRNLDATIQNLGKIYKNYALQFYDAPRVFRVTNDQGVAEYFKMHVEKRDDGSKYGIVRPFVQGDDGQMHESLESKEYLIKGDFDVKVSTGSNLPFAKDQKFSRTRQMFLDGVIDQEEYLKGAEYPNYQVIIDRMNQVKMAEAQAQMMGGAPGGAPPMPPPPAAA